jgi:hypothetical protein
LARNIPSVSRVNESTWLAMIDGPYCAIFTLRSVFNARIGIYRIVFFAMVLVYEQTLCQFKHIVQKQGLFTRLKQVVVFRFVHADIRVQFRIETQRVVELLVEDIDQTQYEILVVVVVVRLVETQYGLINWLEAFDNTVVIVVIVSGLLSHLGVQTINIVVDFVQLLLQWIILKEKQAWQVLIERELQNRVWSDFGPLCIVQLQETRGNLNKR